MEAIERKEKQKKGIIKKITGVLGGVLLAIEVVLLLLLVISRINGGVPTLFGHNMYVIVSPSMTPELEVGDMILSRVYDGGELKVGDVVQYVGKTGDTQGKIITHKIISIDGDVITTKGVANALPDAPITRSDVIGVMKYKFVVIDKIYAVISSTWGFLLLVLLPMCAIIVFEIVNLAIDIRKEKEITQNGESEEK